MTFWIRALAALLVVVSLAACEGMRDALTAHTDLAARAENQQLTATRLADMVGKSRAPLSRDIVRTVAGIWVNYQLLGMAAARGDSLNAPAVIDSAMWSMIASSKARQFYDRISVGWARVDTATAPRMYASGDLLAASHILLLTQNKPDSAKRAALATIRGLKARASAANFAALARGNSEDRGSAERGGSLGVFARGAMVAPFERALVALRPGEISDIVETDYGYHIIRRPTFGEIRSEFLTGAADLARQRAESTYTVRMDSVSRVRIKKGAASRARTAALDVDAHRDDKAELATSSAGPFTVASFVRWLETFPGQQQLPQRLQAAPDSAVEGLIRQFMRNELVVRSADSAGVRVPEDELARIRARFVGDVQQAWFRLGIHPRILADSASTPEAREQLAARRVESYIEAMLADRAPYVPIIPQIESVLRSRYNARVNAAGVDRALQLAQRVRAQADSARAAQQPPSVVPVPTGDTTGPDTGRR